MDANIASIAIAAIVVNGLLIGYLARAWLARRHPPPPVPHDQLENIEMRLVQLQQAVDDVAIEMERLAEGQRFTAKLLAERGDDEERSEREVSER